MGKNDITWGRANSGVVPPDQKSQQKWGVKPSLYKHWFDQLPWVLLQCQVGKRHCLYDTFCYYRCQETVTSFRGQARWVKMTSPRGELTAVLCRPTKRVNKTEELNRLSINIGLTSCRDYCYSAKLGKDIVSMTLFVIIYAKKQWHHLGGRLDG